LNILSIQSWVAYGHVGNASAVFPLQRLGAEVWAINTVQFSNHTGYGDWTGEVFSGDTIRSLIDGIERRGALARCDAVLSGYVGDTGIGAAILDAVSRVRAANPAALYCCDPVIGDAGEGVYVRPGIADMLRIAALPAADIATPNQFELELLTGLSCTTIAQAKTAAVALQAQMHAAGPRVVLATSLHTDATPAGSLDLLAGEHGQFYLLRTERLPITPNGAGDAIAALFLFHRLRTGSTVAALEAAASSIHGMLRRTTEAGSTELLLIAAQDELIAPTSHFKAERC
jgi:pyridoxine kinase